MVTAKKVVKRRPPPDWRKAVDDIIRKKRPVKLILLHTCDENEEIAINPELILEIGNDTDDEEPPQPEDEFHFHQSRVSDKHEARLYLDAHPFQVGDLLRFSGLTRVGHLNGVSGRMRSSPSSMVAGYQIMPGQGKTELVVHNYGNPFTVMGMGNETGFVYKPKAKIKCGFFTCCGGKEIETKETMEEILIMIMKAGIGTVFDPTGAIDKLADESIGR